MLSGHLRLLNLKTGRLGSPLGSLFCVYLFLSAGKIDKTWFQDTHYLIRNVISGRSWNLCQEAVGRHGQFFIRGRHRAVLLKRETMINVQVSGERSQQSMQVEIVGREEIEGEWSHHQEKHKC